VDGWAKYELEHNKDYKSGCDRVWDNFEYQNLFLS